MNSGLKWSFPNKWYYHCFIAATCFCAVTGIFLLAHTTRDFSRFYVLQWHIRVGASNFIFAALSLRAYIRASDEIRKPRFPLLPTFLILFLPFPQLTYFVAWFTGLFAWAVISKKRFRMLLLLFTVVFSSGLYLAGPFRATLRTGFFVLNHEIAALTAIVWLHFAIRAVEKRREAIPARSRRARMAAAFVILFFTPAADTIVKARRDNARFLYPPARLQSGYAFSISSGATLTKPQKDPTPYLQDSASCGVRGCHPDLYKQWLVSSHRFAATNEPYRKIVEEFAERFGREATSLCARCHSPMTVMYGIPDRIGEPLADKLRGEGISCQYCHAITHTNPQAGNGNAHGVLKPAFLTPINKARAGDARTRKVFLLRQIQSHRLDYGEAALPPDKWCGSCHRAVIPKKFTAGHKLILGDTYTPWKKSFRKHGLSCVDCHMPLTTYASKVHAHSDHRIFGINQAMHRLVPPGKAPRGLIREFDRSAALWLQGRLPVPEYELWFLRILGHGKYKAYKKFFNKSGAAILTIDAKKDAAARTVTTTVKLSNNTQAHNFPAYPLDLTEVWITVTATDARGKILFQNCAPARQSADTALGCPELGGVPVDAAGRPIQKHRFWDVRDVKQKAIIPPGGSMKYSYSWEIPKHAKTPVSITARCLFRRYNQTLNMWIYGPHAPPFPETELSKAQTIIR